MLLELCGDVHICAAQKAARGDVSEALASNWRITLFRRSALVYERMHSSVSVQAASFYEPGFPRQFEAGPQNRSQCSVVIALRQQCYFIRQLIVVHDSTSRFGA